MLELWEDPKWFAIFAIGIALACAIGYSADAMATSHSIDSCVSSGGDWTDIHDGPGTTMGCRHP